MRTRKGFTLVELAVVIVIIGVLAAFGVPKFLQSVEKSKAAEAFNYLSAIQAVRSGTWPRTASTPARSPTSTSPCPLPSISPSRRTITVTPDSAGNPAWSLMLTRNANSSYAYTVNWTQIGFDTSTHLDHHDLPADLPGHDQRVAPAAAAR